MAENGQKRDDFGQATIKLTQECAGCIDHFLSHGAGNRLSSFAAAGPVVEEVVPPQASPNDRLLSLCSSPDPNSPEKLEGASPNPEARGGGRGGRGGWEGGGRGEGEGG